jgi:hypothetical protein
MWRNTRYQLQLRHRVNVGIKSPPDVMRQIEAELTRCEQAIDILKAELDALTTQLVAAPNGNSPATEDARQAPDSINRGQAPANSGRGQAE